MPYRFAFISAMTGSPWGGSELLWSQAASFLSLQGHAVMASVHGWPQLPKPLEVLRANGVQIYERKTLRRTMGCRVLTRIQGLFRKKPAFSTEWASIFRFKPDLVVISHGGTLCGLQWMLRCRRDGIRYVSISQGFSERDWIRDDELEDVSSAYSECHKAYFVSLNNLKLLEIKLGLRLNQAEFVWNPFNLPWDTEVSWPDETRGFKLACVGRLEPYDKGQDILCQIMDKPHWRQRNLVINLYGQGSCRESISKLIKMLKLDGKIVFCGQENDIRKVWRQNHGAVIPSRSEGLPLALIEAMLSQRFAIVTDVGDTARLIVDNLNGFVAKAPTVDIFEEAMERAWSRHQDWREIGRNARSHIKKIVPPNPGELFAEKILKDCL